jgi:hypothetical protein
MFGPLGAPLIVKLPLESVVVPTRGFVYQVEQLTHCAPSVSGMGSEFGT